MSRRYPNDAVLHSPAAVLDHIMVGKDSRAMTDDQLRQWMEESAFDQLDFSLRPIATSTSRTLTDYCGNLLPVRTP
jgi:hypothetical protein